MKKVILYRADSTEYAKYVNVDHIHLSSVRMDGMRTLLITLRNEQDKEYSVEIDLQQGMFIGVW